MALLPPASCGGRSGYSPTQEGIKHIQHHIDVYQVTCAHATWYSTLKVQPVQ